MGVFVEFLMKRALWALVFFCSRPLGETVWVGVNHPACSCGRAAHGFYEKQPREGEKGRVALDRNRDVAGLIDL